MSANLLRSASSSRTRLQSDTKSLIFCLCHCTRNLQTTSLQLQQKIVQYHHQDAPGAQRTAPRKTEPYQINKVGSKNQKFEVSIPLEAKGVNKDIQENLASHSRKSAQKDRERVFKKPLSRQRTLTPAVLRSRVRELSEVNKLDEAIQVVDEAPTNKLDTSVWNVLLKSIFAVGRYNLAYSVYLKMKKHRYPPNIATYIIMLSGMSKIDDWADRSRQLRHCHNIYDSYREYMEFCKEKGLRDELANSPIVLYAKILSKAGLYQNFFDLLFSVEETGPLAPNEYFYSTCFNALLRRESLENPGVLSVREQNASDAKLIWRRMEIDVRRNNTKIDSSVLVSALEVFSYGRPSDLQFGLDLVQRYIGSLPPEVTTIEGNVDINQYLFSTILDLCLRAQNYDLCTRYGKQIIDWWKAAETRVQGLDLTHAEIYRILVGHYHLAKGGSRDELPKALQLYRWAASKGEDLCPTTNEFNTMLAICEFCNDWTAACEVLEISTGISVNKFRNGNINGEKTDDALSTASSSSITVRARPLTHIARTALASHQITIVQQCLLIMTHFDINRIYAGFRSSPDIVFYFQRELADAIIKMVDFTSNVSSPAERKQWEILKANSQRIVNSKRKPIVPRTEDLFSTLQPKESVPLEKLQQGIDFESATRYS